MSAYIVSKTHIDALLTAGLYSPWNRYGPLRWFDADPEAPECFEAGEPWGRGSASWHNQHARYLRDDHADEVGSMLWAENRRSVNHRYSEDETVGVYEFSKLPGFPEPLIVPQALSGYEYQSCEHPGWGTSEAKRFCDALTATAIRNLRGYDESPGWAIDNRLIFVGPSA